MKHGDDLCFLFAGLRHAPGGQPFQWPTVREMLEITKRFGISIWKEQIYLGTQVPPWEMPDEAARELRALFAAARSDRDHACCAYSTWFDAFTPATENEPRRYWEPNEYLAEVRRLVEVLGLSGLYVDGRRYPYNAQRPCSRNDNLAVARALRCDIFGESGCLVGHFTGLKQDGEWDTPDIELERYFAGLGRRGVVLLGEDKRLKDDAALSARYAREQIEPRLAAGIRVALLPAAGHLAYASMPAVGYVSMTADGAGGTRFGDGTRTAYYRQIIANRIAANC